MLITPKQFYFQLRQRPEPYSLLHAVARRTLPYIKSRLHVSKTIFTKASYNMDELIRRNIFKIT